MICGADEIGMGADDGGIMVLDVTAKAGTKASDYFNLKQTLSSKSDLPQTGLMPWDILVLH